MTSGAKLKERWRRPPFDERDRQAVEWLRAAKCQEPWRPGFVPTPSAPDLEPLGRLLEGLPFRSEVPSGWDLRGCSVTGVLDAVLVDIDFSFIGRSGHALSVQNSVLRGCRFDDSGAWTEVWGSFQSCSFRRARLTKCSMIQSEFRDCSFDGAKMIKVSARQSDFRGSSFRGARLREAGLTLGDLRGCDFTDADLTGASLIGARLDGTTIFRGARLLDVWLEQDEHVPPEHRLPRVDLSVTQTDERTEISEHVLDVRGAMRQMVHVVERHLVGYRDRRWAPVVQEVLTRAREDAKAMPETAIPLWVEEVMARVHPEEQEEVAAFFEQAMKRLL